jgi:hypothetical protein
MRSEWTPSPTLALAVGIAEVSSCSQHASDAVTDPGRNDRPLFRIPYWSFAVGLLVVTVVRVGVGAFPDIDFDLSVSKAVPTVPALGIYEQYALYSPIGLVLARVFGVTTRSGWLVLHGVLLAGGLAAVFARCRARHGDLAARFAAMTLSSSAVPVIVLGWLGSYDIFGIVLSSALVVTESATLSALAGFALAFANFEQGIVALATLAGLAAAGLFGRVSRFVAAGAGLVIGRVILTWFLRANGAGADRLSFLTSHDSGSMVRMSLRNAPLIVATALGAAVLLVIATALQDRLPRRDRILWLAAFVPPVLVATLGLDQTRVIALLSWPVLLALALTAAQHWPRQLVQRLGIAMVALSLVFPAVYVWEGNVHAVGWSNVAGRLQGASGPP